MRACGKLEEADLVFALFDGSAEADADDLRFLARIRELKAKGTEVFVLINKSDLPARIDRSLFEEFSPVLTVSARDGNTAELQRCVEDRFLSGKLSYDGAAILTNARQFAAPPVSALHSAHSAMP